MEKLVIGKGLIIALLGLGAFGLLAAEPSRDLTVDIAFPERATTAQDALDAAASPRECDLQRGIDTDCTFV